MYSIFVFVFFERKKNHRKSKTQKITEMHCMAFLLMVFVESHRILQNWFWKLTENSWSELFLIPRQNDKFAQLILEPHDLNYSIFQDAHIPTHKFMSHFILWLHARPNKSSCIQFIITWATLTNQGTKCTGPFWEMSHYC